MNLFDLLSDNAILLLRWLHVATAMTWVGSAFALARLDLGMRPRGEDGPQTLLLHAGAGFRFLRAEQASAAEPALNFKWEAYVAWLSGFALLGLIFFAAPELNLIDPQLWNPPGWAAVAAALAALPLAWLAYDALCKRSGLGGDALLLAVFAFAAALGLVLTQFFAGRAALPLLGAVLATIMAANIAHAIVPAQKRRLASLRAGQPADPADVKFAATRALHNQYLALPVIVFMLAGHAPLLYAGPHNGLAAAAFLAAGFLTRRFFLKNARGLGADWRLAGAAAGFVAIGLLLSLPSIPRREAAGSAHDAIAFAVRPGPEAARAILEQHCLACHSGAAPYPGRTHAAGGLDFSAPGALARHRAAILRAAVFSRAMPPPGAAKPLDEAERLILLRWID